MLYIILLYIICKVVCVCVCGSVIAAMPLLTLRVAETFPLLYLWSCLQRRLRQATSYSKLLQITWSDLMLDWCLRESTSHRDSVVYHSYGVMVDMWHRNICWSIWALIYSIAGQRQDGHHHRRIQQEEVVWSVMSSCVLCLLGRWWQRVTKLRVLRRRGVWVEVSTLASGCFQKCWISDLESSLCFDTLRNSRREFKHKQKPESDIAPDWNIEWPFGHRSGYPKSWRAPPRGQNPTFLNFFFVWKT